MAQMEELLQYFGRADDPLAQIEAEYVRAVDEFAAAAAKFNPFELIESARIAWLPWAPVGHNVVTTDAGAAAVELFAGIAIAATNGQDVGDFPKHPPQALATFVSESRPALDHLVNLAHLRNIARADPADKMTIIGLLVRGNEVWVRNRSYPPMVEDTLRQLFGESGVREALIAGVGFDVEDAIDVLNSIDRLQQARFNQRFRDMGKAVDEAMRSAEGEEAPDAEVIDKARARFMAMWEPSEDDATVTVDDLVSATSRPERIVRAVVHRFGVSLTDVAPGEVVEAFTTGNNPWRTCPVAVTPSGRVMLPHNALTVDAVRQNLEEHLKGSPAWEPYAKHRGDALEARVTAALEKVLPGATIRSGFEYYLPVDSSELQAADPERYSKRVEGDHLVVLDDVALVVEDKAVAFSALARGGKLARIRTDLTGIITKAAEQSGRLADAISRDGGIRVHGEGWVDLGDVREIHTIGVSLDDLSSVATATAELVRTGLLAPANIPWTVSVHDLELIVELVERPAQFLLYLQRRRHPEVTVMYAAADELDLFLYFFEAGLWVEPDPDRVRAAFPFLPAPTTAERRRYRLQRPGFITSRTDPLDRWFYAGRAGGHSPQEADVATAARPRMVASPLAHVLDALEADRPSSWVSIGALLLAQSTESQHKLAADVRRLLANPTGDSKGRSMTIPFAGSTNPDDGWLLVLATLPVSVDRETEERRLREYLRVKKHQLSLPRGALLLFSEDTSELVAVMYDGFVGPLPPELEAKLTLLRPPGALRSRPNPTGWKAQC